MLKFGLTKPERATRIRSASDELPSEQAKVLRMSFFDEHPHTEIATALKLPLGTVKSRLRLAIRRLRTMLGDEI